MIKKRSAAAVRKLMDLRPATARVVRGGVEMEIPAETVEVGDVVLVRPGEKIPTDGVVLEGNSAVDESMLSGESMPADKSPGSSVIGGTLNRTGFFRFKADIATPAALMVGVGKGAENGILIRGGEVLERAEALATVVFDKTGTLTRGEPSVTDVIPCEGLGEQDLLRTAAAQPRSSRPCSSLPGRGRLDARSRPTQSPRHRTSCPLGMEASRAWSTWRQGTPTRGSGRRRER